MSPTHDKELYKRLVSLRIYVQVLATADGPRDALRHVHCVLRKGERSV